MKILRIAAAIALLTGSSSLPVRAQVPNLNLIPELASKTPEEREADEVKDKAYRESLRKIPDAKVSADPWGNVRSDPPKAATSTSKTSTPSKPRTKTGSAAN